MCMPSTRFMACCFNILWSFNDNNNDNNDKNNKDNDNDDDDDDDDDDDNDNDNNNNINSDNNALKWISNQWLLILTHKEQNI